MNRPPSITVNITSSSRVWVFVSPPSSMARLLSQTLFRHSIKSQSTTILLINHRCWSSGKAKIIEIDLSESSSAPSRSSLTTDGGEVVNKLEELMHRLLVQRSTPDWLPFVPGSSFWVPPTRRYTSDSTDGRRVIPVLDFRDLPRLVSVDEQLSVTTSRGWPSAEYFITGSAATHPAEVGEAEGEVEVVEKPEPNEDR